MRRWLLLTLGAAVLLLGATALAWWYWPRIPHLVPAATFASRSAAELAADGRFRGVSWVAADSAASADLTPLLRAHVTWIAQTPFGWQAGAAVPVVQLHTQRRPGRHGYWGESDYGLTQTAQQARRQGIRTLLKPHLWLRGPGGTWPGDIQMQSAADWQAWFASYTMFILHYAQLAEAEQMEALCIGTELEKTVGHEAEWRALIRQVRRVYHGPLTYAANWSGEFEQIRFWDALDFIGIQAYFPLSKANSPGRAELLANWQPHLQAIERVQQKFRKPVVFTEAGYKNTPDTAIEPWKWPDHTATFLPTDEATQAACYDALFATFWPRPWFKGLFVWKWYPGLAADGPARRHADFTPQHKPAEQVMAKWYGK
ncbi:glycoside hydrolase family 113 [Hymenobacter algoricola]|uniref:GTA TIM-barrel-like domain-containing protein n=1 Tax=Hymenobacter algoricola TaxID=486267 RepID=A0ABP7N3N1_9BACT